jgi:hypothetical protein
MIVLEVFDPQTDHYIVRTEEECRIESRLAHTNGELQAVTVVFIYRGFAITPDQEPDLTYDGSLRATPDGAFPRIAISMDTAEQSYWIRQVQTRPLEEVSDEFAEKAGTYRDIASYLLGQLTRIHNHKQPITIGCRLPKSDAKPA